MGRIFITSDLHFWHNKEFLYKPRGFNSVEEMNLAIVDNWNNIVNEEDDVYILGDLLLGGADNLEAGLELINLLPGWLHIVRGNHDTDKRWEAYSQLPKVVEMQNAIYLKYRKYHFYLSHYPTLTANYDETSLHQKTINLCGHSHTPDKWADFDKGLIYHCELDAHNNTPVLLDDILVDIKQHLAESKSVSASFGIQALAEMEQTARKFMGQCQWCSHYPYDCQGARICPHPLSYNKRGICL